MAGEETQEFLRRISDLSQESKGHRLRAKKFREERDTAVRERDQVKQQLAAVTTERNDFKQRLDAAPSELATENERLKGEIRTRDHRTVFNKVAAEMNIRPEALNDLWNLSGYKAETDQPDEGRIKTMIGAAVTERSYLVVEPADAGTGTQPAKPAPQNGPGGQRGAPSQDAGGMTVRTSQMRSAVWMEKNQAKVAEMAEKGLLTIVED